MNISVARKLLEPYNPSWYQKDIDLENVRASILKREPRIFFHIKNNLRITPFNGILTIRGPRRIGKTTSIKLMPIFSFGFSSNGNIG